MVDTTTDCIKVQLDLGEVRMVATAKARKGMVICQWRRKQVILYVLHQILKIILSNKEVKGVLFTDRVCKYNDYGICKNRGCSLMKKRFEYEIFTVKKLYGTNSIKRKQ